MGSYLSCILPWKALFMDERQGEIITLPCCLSWIKMDYGPVKSGSLMDLWNGKAAQYIRQLIASGHQDEVCSKNCPHLKSGIYSELAIRVQEGPDMFVSNQILNNEEIRLRKLVLISKPMLLKVVPTLECNLRCSMCFQKSYESLNLDGYFWEEIKQLYPYLREITFQGGEVTQMKQYREFLYSDELRSYPNLKTSLITNGTILDDGFFDGIKKVAINQITVSLNAASEETYYKITKTHLFDQTIKNIHKLKLLSEMHPVNSFDLLISFVVMKSNFHEIPKFLKLAEHFDAQIQLLPIVGNKGNENIFLDRELHGELRSVLKKCLEQYSGTAVQQIRIVESVLNSY